MCQSKLNVLKIIYGTSVDGPGLRTSIYIAGCKHKCRGCHNPQSWDFNAGTPMTIDEIVEIIKEEDFDVTLSGGDPLYHPKEVKELIDRTNKLGHSVWVYTGFTWEEIVSSEFLLSAVENAEAVVEGRFKIDQRNESLPFRGSTNQRIIRPRSTKAL